jgi:hypothetical protein
MAREDDAQDGTTVLVSTVAQTFGSPLLDRVQANAATPARPRSRARANRTGSAVRAATPTRRCRMCLTPMTRITPIRSRVWTPGCWATDSPRFPNSFVAVEPDVDLALDEPPLPGLP